MKDEHAKDAAQGAAEDVPQDAAQNLAFGARAARALLATPPPPPCLCAVRAEMGAQLGSSVAFGPPHGGARTLPGGVRTSKERESFWQGKRVGVGQIGPSSPPHF